MAYGVEPSAEIRSLAKQIRQMYVALIDEGFTDQQALTLLGTWFGNIPGSPPPDEPPGGQP